jgi:general secretion pathway protein A
MYEQFFGLRERPFDLTPNPKFLMLTPGHREALASLVYGLARRNGLTVLIGEAGTGKTTLLRTALERQTDEPGYVYLNNPTLTRAEFVEFLAVRFGLPERAQLSKAQFLVAFEQRLRERNEANQASVLIIDEAQSLPYELLEEVRLLANMETADRKLLTVVLAGQPELGDRLDEPQLRQLKQRVALRCELRPLTANETASYIKHRIEVAGGVASDMFTRDAVVLIHQRTHGIPRTVSVLSDNALVTAFAMGQRPVSRRIVEEVCRDFALAETHLPAVAADSGAERSDPRVTPESASQQADGTDEAQGTRRRWFQSSAGPVRLARSVLDRGYR